MIAELLAPAKVVPGLKGDFNKALELLCPSLSRYIGSTAKSG
jgi:hypothetical protein